MISDITVCCGGWGVTEQSSTQQGAGKQKQKKSVIVGFWSFISIPRAHNLSDVLPTIGTDLPLPDLPLETFIDI